RAQITRGAFDRLGRDRRLRHAANTRAETCSAEGRGSIEGALLYRYAGRCREDRGVGAMTIATEMGGHDGDCYVDYLQNQFRITDREGLETAIDRAIHAYIEVDETLYDRERDTLHKVAELLKKVHKLLRQRVLLNETTLSPERRL